MTFRGAFAWGAVDEFGGSAFTGLQQDAGNDGNHPSVVAAIDGQIGEELVFQRAAGLGVGRVYDGDGFGDGDSLGLLAGLHADVHANIAAGADLDILALDGLKAHELGADGVDAGIEIGSGVLSSAVGGQGSRDRLWPYVGDRHRGGSDSAAALIGNRTWKIRLPVLSCAMSGKAIRNTPAAAPSSRIAFLAWKRTKDRITPWTESIAKSPIYLPPQRTTGGVLPPKWCRGNNIAAQEVSTGLSQGGLRAEFRTEPGYQRQIVNSSNI